MTDPTDSKTALAADLPSQHYYNIPFLDELFFDRFTEPELQKLNKWLIQQYLQNNVLRRFFSKGEATMAYQQAHNQKSWDYDAEALYDKEKLR